MRVPEDPIKNTHPKLKFSEHSKKYLGKDLMDDLQLFSDSIADLEDLIKSNDLTMKETMDYMTLSGILSDLPFISHLAEKITEHIAFLNKQMASQYSDKNKRRKIIKERCYSDLKDLADPTSRPLMRTFIAEILKICDNSVLISLAEDMVQRRRPSVNLYSEENLYEKVAKNLGLLSTTGRKNANDVGLGILLFSRTLQLSNYRISNDLIESIKAGNAADFERLKYIEIDPPASLNVGSNTGLKDMRDYSLYVGPDLKDFELVRVRIKFNADKAREIMFSISRLTGELVMPGSCYASIKPIFDKYGLSDVYEYVKNTVYFGFNRAIKNGTWHEVETDEDEKEEEEEVEAASEELKEEIQSTLGAPKVEPKVREARKTYQKGKKESFKNMTYEEVAEVLAKFGVYELEDRSTSHIILRKDLPDGKRLTYPLPGGHGAGKVTGNMLRIIRNARDKFKISKEEFLDAL